MSEPNELLKIFKENNIAIVGDDLAQESRLWRTPGRKEGTVWEKMAYRVADQKGDCFLYEPDKKRGQMMIDQAKERNAKGVVVFMMKFAIRKSSTTRSTRRSWMMPAFRFCIWKLTSRSTPSSSCVPCIQSYAEMIG